MGPEVIKYREHAYAGGVFMRESVPDQMRNGPGQNCQCRQEPARRAMRDSTVLRLTQSCIRPIRYNLQNRGLYEPECQRIAGEPYRQREGQQTRPVTVRLQTARGV